MKIHSEAEILKAALSAEMAYSTEHSENYLERAAKLRKIYGEDIKIHSFSKEDDQNIENIKPGGYIIEVPSSNELVICFRGTKMGLNYKQEIYNDVDGSPVKMKFGEGDVLLHRGFKSEYERSKNLMIAKLNSIDGLDNKKITIAGHSLGGAVSLIAALDLSKNKILEQNINPSNINVVNFGAPKVFTRTNFQNMISDRLSPSKNKSSTDFCDGVDFYNDILKDRTTRVCIESDPITKLPLIRSFYDHVGDNEINLQSEFLFAHTISTYIDHINETMSPSLELPELNQTEYMKELKEKIMFVLEDENILDKKSELTEMGIKDNEAQNILEHVEIIKYHESKMQETSVNKEDYNAHKDVRDINALILEEAIEKECKIKSSRKNSFDSLDGFTDTESTSFSTISRKNSFDSLDGFTDTESVYSSRSLTPNPMKFIDSVISDMVQESKEKISGIIENYSQDNHDNSYQSLIDHGINKKEANILISEIKNVKFAQKQMVNFSRGSTNYEGYKNSHDQSMKKINKIIGDSLPLHLGLSASSPGVDLRDLSHVSPSSTPKSNKNNQINR